MVMRLTVELQIVIIKKKHQADAVTDTVRRKQKKHNIFF